MADKILHVIKSHKVDDTQRVLRVVSPLKDLILLDSIMYVASSPQDQP